MSPIERFYFIEKTLLQFHQKELYEILKEKYSHRILTREGVIYDDMSIRWNEEKHRFCPIDFFHELSENEFNAFEDDVYYGILEGQSLEDIQVMYYICQIKEDIYDRCERDFRVLVGV